MIHKFKTIVHETQKAILFEFDQGESWVPKALISGMNSNEVVIWDQFEFSYIKKDNIDDMFDEIDDEPEKIKKPDIIKRIISKVFDDDLDWLMDPNWKPKKVFYNGKQI